MIFGEADGWMERRTMYLETVPGFRTALLDGTMVPDSPMHMATEKLYYGCPGDVIRICNKKYVFAVAVFSLERDEKYIYSYDYQKEENWTSYTQNLKPEDYGTQDFSFDRECYFRVCVKRRDGRNMTPEDVKAAEKLLEFTHTELPYQPKAVFGQEITDTVRDIRKLEKPGRMKLCLLADTHATINGTWKDTADNIRRVASEIDYDAIIHLGDLTDGMLAKHLTEYYVQDILKDLDECGVPVYITPGNHDTNYFRNNGNIYTNEEMKRIYRLPVSEENGGADYFVDNPEYAVRMIFLSSFDSSEPLRYGYHESQLMWLERVLADAPCGTRFLVFSHDAPLAKLDYWSVYIRNGEALLDLLEKYNRKEDYQVIAFFYGHTHADYIFEECSFPLISIGCAKLEYFTDKKPTGAVTWKRKADDVTQDLWDSLVIDFEKQALSLIRFGAGKDRTVSYAPPERSVWKENKSRRRADRRMKLWAHRGASAHAPENTMPAFELAKLLGADGIELDVQLTKDHIPVVIHDERIDRTCDGTGWVKDYTLDELRQFNAARKYPAYGKVEIPTLEEFYQWVADTDLIVNLELKNSVVPYEGLENSVLELAKAYGLEDRIIYSSFNHYSVRRLKQLCPTVRAAFLYSDVILDIAEYADKYNVDAVHPSLKNLEYSDIVKECHAEGIGVHVWTVNDEADFERLDKLGVDAIITNYVEKGSF